MTEQDASESLFDNKFTSDSTESTDDSSILPSSGVTTAIIGLRLLVSVKEAGIIIGKSGSVIADIRDRTGVKAGVSQVVQGCPDRILTVTGPIDATAEALRLISKALLESPLDDSLFQYFPLKRLLSKGPEGTTSLRLLVPNAQMGTIIGRQGSRIKALQETYHVKIVASKDYLYNSTERLVELQGVPEDIESATKILSRFLIEDWHTATGTHFYIPQPRNARRTSNPSAPEITKTENFPADMVGCLIGKSGSRIQEIRKISGAQITIASADDEEGQREFTLVGSSRSVEKALSLLYQNLDREKERREKQAAEVEA